MRTIIKKPRKVSYSENNFEEMKKVLEEVSPFIDLLIKATPTGLKREIITGTNINLKSLLNKFNNG